MPRVPDEPPTPPKSPPPAGPYREPWKAAETATHIEQFERAAELQKHLLNLRRDVDAGKLDLRMAPELSDLIARLTEAREKLRRFVRYRVGGPRWALGVIGSFGALSGLYTTLKGMPLIARPELLVFLVVVVAAIAVLCLVLLTNALRWGDCLSEYDGLIADLRKLAEARRKGGSLPTNLADIVLSIPDTAIAELDEELRKLRATRNRSGNEESRRRAEMLVREVLANLAALREERVRVVPGAAAPEATSDDADANPVQTPAEDKKRGES